MPHWVLRALGMSVLHAAATVALAKITVFQPGETTVSRTAAIALLVGAAALWGALDGWFRRPDSGRTWFIAGLVSGPAAGLLSVIGKSVLVDRTGVSELGPALTSGAAFTALLVLVPAWLGVFVGSRLPRRGADLDDATGRDGEHDSGRNATAHRGGSHRRHRVRGGETPSVGDTGEDVGAGTQQTSPDPAPVSSHAPTAAGRDERNETVLLAKPRPDRRPRPTPRLRARLPRRHSDDRTAGDRQADD